MDQCLDDAEQELRSLVGYISSKSPSALRYSYGKGKYAHKLGQDLEHRLPSAGLNDLEAQKELAAVRAKLWQITTAIQKAQEEQAALEQEIFRKSTTKANLEGSVAYMDIQTENLKDFQGNVYPKIDLVPLEVFQQDNPDIEVDSLSSTELIAERLTDEEHRRATLYTKRWYVQRDHDTLSGHVTELRKGLSLTSAKWHDINLMNEGLHLLSKYASQRGIGEQEDDALQEPDQDDDEDGQ